MKLIIALSTAALGENTAMTPKSVKHSKTIRVGAFYISIGIIIGILQALDMLEVILVSVDIENVPGVATWGGLILAIIGGIQVWLRMITSQPIGSSKK